MNDIYIKTRWILSNVTTSNNILVGDPDVQITWSNIFSVELADRKAYNTKFMQDQTKLESNLVFV